MLTGRYEPETTKLLKKLLKPGMVFIDVGAHIGYFTRLAAGCVGGGGHVYAFEPDRENHALLKENTRQFQNVTREKYAVSEKNGSVSFYHIENSTGSHSTLKPAEAVREETVQTVSLDDYCMQKNTVPGVIKMDIEGGEPAALRGMKQILQTPHLQIVMEYNQAALERANDPDFLDTFAADYSLQVITTHGLVTLEKPYHEAVKKHLGKEGSVNLYCTRI